MSVRLAATALGLLVAVALAAAERGRTFERRAPARAHGPVEIVWAGGSVTIVGWAREEVFARAEDAGLRVRDLRLEADGEQTRIRLGLDRSASPVPGPEAAAELVVRVPAASEVVVRTADAAIAARALTGSIAATSASGAIAIEGRLRDVETLTASGATALDVDALRAVVETASGEIEIRGRVEALRARTASGALRVAAPVVRATELESVTGGVVFEGPVGEHGRLRIATRSGSVKLVLPADVDARFRLATASGTIASAFGAAGGGELRRLETATGAGAASIEVESASGAIELARGPASPAFDPLPRVD